MSDLKQLHRIIEGALFASSEPLSVERIAALFAEEAETPDKKDIRQALQDLIENYAERGVELKELASGYQFQVKADLAKWIKRLWEERPPRYSRALLETLVLVAYRQPITRGEIEEVRGVTVSTNIMKTLLDREWIKVVGHRDVPGKPGLYATTKVFLDYFGLKSLEDLPPLAEVRDLDKAGEKLQEHLDAAVESVIAEEKLIATNAEHDTVTNAVHDEVVENEEKLIAANAEHDTVTNAAHDEVVENEENLIATNAVHDEAVEDDVVSDRELANKMQQQDDVDDFTTSDLLSMYSEAEESLIAANAVHDEVAENDVVSDRGLANKMQQQDDIDDFTTSDLLSMYSEAEESFGQASEDIVE